MDELETASAMAETVERGIVETIKREKRSKQFTLTFMGMA